MPAPSLKPQAYGSYAERPPPAHDKNSSHPDQCVCAARDNLVSVPRFQPFCTRDSGLKLAAENREPETCALARCREPSVVGRPRLWLVGCDVLPLDSAAAPSTTYCLLPSHRQLARGCAGRGRRAPAPRQPRRSARRLRPVPQVTPPRRCGPVRRPSRGLPGPGRCRVFAGSLTSSAAADILYLKMTI